MSANTEKCSDKDKSFCEYNEFSRLRYFHGMLLDDKDFRAEQQYHAGKRRFLNRMLHGSGVVCGLELKGEKDKRWIKVTSGLAFDCSGNEIWVSEEQKIDLATLLPPKQKPKGEPECKPVDAGDDLKTYYIGVRYEEKPTSPVSVYLPSGSCEERTCENSRWKEGYCIEIVECCEKKEDPGLLVALCECEGSTYSGDYKDICGKCGKDPNKPDDRKTYKADPVANTKYCQCLRLEEFCEQSVPCGECCSCDTPCFVILGQIKVDDKCTIQQLCMNECRRYVLTGRLVQRLIIGVLNGAEKYFTLNVDGHQFQLTSAVDLAYNPIKALCDMFSKFGVEGEKPELKDCHRKKEPPTDIVALQNKLMVLEQRHDTLQNEFSQLRQNVEPQKAQKKN